MKQIIESQDAVEFESISDLMKSAAIFRPLVLLSHENDLFGDGAEEKISGDDHLKVVVVAPKFNFERMVALFNKGARGYQLENVSPAVMQSARQIVALGELAFPSTLADHLAGAPKDSGLFLLSSNEKVVLPCLARGCANKEISRSVGIIEATTKVHVKATMRKLGVMNRTQIAVWAVRHGFDSPTMRH